MAIETYYYGQGKVFSRKTTPGAKWRWWGDVSALSLAAEVEKVQHKESFSGQKGLARDFSIGKTLTLSATLHQIDTTGLEDALHGKRSTIAAGNVVDEDVGNVAVGDTVKLAFGGVSAVVVTDSDGAPAVIAPANYVLDPVFGGLEFVALPSAPAPTMPLKVSYTHAGGEQVNFVSQPTPVMQFRYEGVNLAENNAPVVVEIYRLSTDPLQDLALITDGTDVAGMQIAAAALIDTSKPAGGDLGQFGRFIQLNAPA